MIARLSISCPKQKPAMDTRTDLYILISPFAHAIMSVLGFFSSGRFSIAVGKRPFLIPYSGSDILNRDV
jgi:hypothetical protein